MQSLVSSVQIEDSYGRRSCKDWVRSRRDTSVFDASSNQVAQIASSAVVEAGCVDEPRSSCSVVQEAAGG